jgi:dUTP pyrophosphatase
MKIKIKKLNPNAIIPKYAKEGDAGMDLVAVSKEEINPLQIRYGTGLAVEIPEGYVGLIFPRSSIMKAGLSLSNAVGVIDSGYRGELMAVFNKKMAPHAKNYEVGDRIAQIIILPYPYIKFEEVSDLSDSARGDGGFGSTGL